MLHKQILSGKNVLEKVKNPGRGKVQIIIIGASWCAPCKVVLEQIRELMSAYADKDVCFSFISITPDNQAGRDIYRDRGINDESVYFASEEEYFFLSRTFSPMGLPHGILINRKGKIVDNGSHVRPSMGYQLHEKIDLLLKQDNLIKSYY